MFGAGGNFRTLGSGIGSMFRKADPLTKDKGGFLRSLVRKYDPKTETYGDLSMGKLALGGLGAAAVALPFMGGGDDEDDGPVDQMDPRYQVQRARNFYSGAGNAGAGLDFIVL